jgi:hypothetical protein
MIKHILRKTGNQDCIFNIHIRNFIIHIRPTIGNFSNYYEYDYKYKIHHFRDNYSISAVSQSPSCKLVVMELLTTRFLTNLLFKGQRTMTFVWWHMQTTRMVNLVLAVVLVVIAKVPNHWKSTNGRTTVPVINVKIHWLTCKWHDQLKFID